MSIWEINSLPWEKQDNQSSVEQGMVGMRRIHKTQTIKGKQA